MPVHDFNAQRLFLDASLASGGRVAASPEQANYLLAVLRLAEDDPILVFNGRDGEWRATVAREGKRGAALVIEEQTRPQEAGPDIHYLFAPLKRARLDYMVEKATEMGVARLMPVLTRRTVPDRVNLERMRANAIEAAEQCGILRIPEVSEPERLEPVLSRWDERRKLVFCDEAAPEADPAATLRAAFDAIEPPASCAVLVGPEGGFDPEERRALLSRAYTIPIRLGPRIMRADTAAVAALALVNAVVGDWR